MGEFVVPAGDPTAIRTAATALATLSTSLHTSYTAVTKGARTAIEDWKGKRATDFHRAALTVQDEVLQASSVMGQAATALTTYANALETAQSTITTANTSVDTADAAERRNVRKDPDDTLDYQRAAQSTYDTAQGDASDAQTSLRNAVQALVTALDALTRQIIAKDVKLNPADLRRAVDETMGGPANFYDQYSTDGLYTMFGGVQGNVFTTAPPPNSKGFAAWFASLDPLQRQLEMQKLNSQFTTKDFNPYATIKPGQLPTWAVRFNNTYLGACGSDLDTSRPYGYFGGGTVLGPGGTQWPIVMPYVTKDGKVYMADSGVSRTDGGIDQLDGKDPGWRTVAQYRGVSQFGSVPGSTKLIVIGENATGQELEVNEDDAGAVVVDANGIPHAGSDATRTYGGPPDKAYWDVLPSEGVDDLAKGSTALGVQLGQGFAAAHALDSHAQRRYYIDYQVNDDGRTRAVLHTFTTGERDGKTVVGSLANGFPEGKHKTTEIPYNVRYNPSKIAMSSPLPDPDVIYTGGPGNPVDPIPLNDPTIH